MMNDSVSILKLIETMSSEETWLVEHRTERDSFFKDVARNEAFFYKIISTEIIHWKSGWPL